MASINFISDPRDLNCARSPSVWDLDSNEDFPNVTTDVVSKSNVSNCLLKRFYVVEICSKERSFHDFNPFIINKFISNNLGDVKQVKKLRDGQLLVELISPGQANILSKLKSFNNLEIKISPHRSLNTRQGIIRCRDLKNCSEEDVVDGLKDFHVIQARHFMRRSGEESIPTGTWLLTFDRTDLPKEIKVGYMNLKVETFIPNPMKCFNCHKLGHTQVNCSSPKICGTCGLPESDNHVNSCSKILKCVNCGLNHASTDRSCEKWKIEKEIKKIQVTKNISYFEAKKQVSSFEETYASKVMEHKSVSCQTIHNSIVDDNNILDIFKKNNIVVTPSMSNALKEVFSLLNVSFDNLNISPICLATNDAVGTSKEVSLDSPLPCLAPSKTNKDHEFKKTVKNSKSVKTSSTNKGLIPATVTSSKAKRESEPNSNNPVKQQKLDSNRGKKGDKSITYVMEYDYSDDGE